MGERSLGALVGVLLFLIGALIYLATQSPIDLYGGFSLTDLIGILAIVDGVGIGASIMSWHPWHTS
jgi:hypothetical protein